MRKVSVILSLISLSIFLIITSCNKNDEKTPKDYLTDGSWIINDIELDPGIELVPGVPITDVYDLFYTEECMRDDLIIFNSDGTITEDEGLIKCDPNAPQTTTENTWEMSDDGTTISATFFGLDSGSAEIIVLNENIFMFSTTVLPDFAVQLGIENQVVTVTMSKHEQ